MGGERNWENGQEAEAAQWKSRLENLRAEDPDQCKEMLVLCRRIQAHYIQKEDWEAAFQAGKQELALLQMHAQAPGMPMAVLCRRLGQLAVRMGDIQEALHWYNALLAQHLSNPGQPDSMDGWNSDWRVYTTLLEQHDPLEPKTAAQWAQQLERVLPEQDPRVLRAWGDVGFMCLNADDPQGAIAALRRSLPEPLPEGTCASTFHALGIAYNSQGAYAEALQAMEQCLHAMELAPQMDNAMHRDAVLRRTLLLERLGSTEEALSSAKATIAHPEFATRSPQERIILYHAAARLHRRKQEHAQALAMYRASLEEKAEDIAPLQDRAQLGIADCLEALGQLEAALELLLEVQQERSARLGEDSLEAAELFSRIHNLLYKLKRYEEARRWCQKEIVFYASHPEQADALNHAVTCFSLYIKNTDEKEILQTYEALEQAALAAGEKGENVYVLLVLQKATYLYQNHKTSEAWEALQVLFPLADAHWDIHDNKWECLLEMAARILDEKGDTLQALHQLTRYMSIRLAAGDTQYIDHARTYRKMAALAQKLGQPKLARELLTQSLASMHHVEGYDREWAITLQDLGYLSLRLQAVQDAHTYFQQAAVLCEQSGLTQDTLYTDVLRGQGRVEFVLRQFEASKTTLMKVRDICTATGNEASLASSLMDLAETLNALKEKDAAIKAAQQGLRLRQKLLPLRHTLVGIAQNTMAKVYSDAGRLDDAIHAYRRAAQCFQGKEAEAATVLADISFNIGMLLRQQEKWGQAKDALQDAVNRFDAIHGMQERAAVIRLALAEIQIIQGNDPEGTHALLSASADYWQDMPNAPLQRMMEMHLLWGMYWRDQKDPAMAKDHFQQALSCCYQDTQRFEAQIPRLEGFLKELDRSFPPMPKAKIIPFPLGRENKPKEDA